VSRPTPVVLATVVGRSPRCILPKRFTRRSSTGISSAISPEHRAMTYPINRRQFVQFGLLGGVALASDLVPLDGMAAERQEVLYNGIRLTSPWPPQLKELPKELPTP